MALEFVVGQSGYTIQIDLVLIFLVRILVVCANADMSASGLADIPYVAFDVAFGGKADIERLLLLSKLPRMLTARSTVKKVSQMILLASTMTPAC